MGRFYAVLLCTVLSICHIRSQCGPNLKNLYDECLGESTECELFLNNFPKTADCFIRTFGYSTDSLQGITFGALYEDEELIREYFRLCESLNSQSNAYDILFLASQLDWQVDGVNLYLHELLACLLNKESTFSHTLINVLHSQPPRFAYRVWAFCLSGYIEHGQEEWLQERFASLLETVSGYRTLRIALKKAYKDKTSVPSHQNLK